MLRTPPRHRAPPCPISAGMSRPIPSSTRRRAHRHPVPVRAGAPPAPLRPHQARPLAPRVPAVQPPLRQLVRLACRTAEATIATVKPPLIGWLNGGAMALRSIARRRPAGRPSSAWRRRPDWHDGFTILQQACAFAGAIPRASRLTDQHIGTSTLCAAARISDPSLRTGGQGPHVHEAATTTIHARQAHRIFSTEG